jgi:hypothetical protein
LNESRVAWSGPNGVVNLARDLGISRRLGFLLDAMNFEAKRPMVRQEVLKDVKKDVAGRSSEMFPRDEISFSHYRELRNKLAHQSLLTDKEIDELERAKKRFEGYGELSEKWGIQAILSRDVIRKVLDDLGVELGKE